MADPPNGKTISAAVSTTRELVAPELFVDFSVHYDMRLSLVRIVAAIVMTCSLAWLADNVNTHGNWINSEVDAAFEEFQRTPLGDPEGLNLIECMCGPPAYGVGGWVGLWLVTVLIGGVPTAVLIRAERRA